MLDFITVVIGAIVNIITPGGGQGLQDLWRSLTDAISTLAKMLHTIFGLQRAQWPRVAGASRNLVSAVSDFMGANYSQWARLRRHDIPFLENWISWLGGTLRIAITVERKQRVSDVNLARAQAHNYTHSVLWWVVIHVLGFLYRILRGVLGWISREGSTMWYYFTHLEKFGELLFWFIVTALEKFAWDAGKRLGTFFLSLIVHNVVRFATLIETVVDAVL